MSHDLIERPGTPAGAAWRPRRHRAGLRVAACLAVVLAALAWITVRGLTGSFVYYLTPTDVVAHHKAQAGQRIRLGGYVVPGTVHRSGGVLTFTVADNRDSMRVTDTGPVPELFKAGQGVVLEGALGRDGRFHADNLLVQHSGDYTPPKPGEAPPHRADLSRELKP